MKIKSKDELVLLYPEPREIAIKKEHSFLALEAIDFIKNSPFIVISTSDKKGNMDTSPRGGAPGFVKILNNKCIVIPDVKGNNRIDSLINITELGRISGLFLIPGIGETLRVGGAAHLSNDETILSLFTEEAKPPTTAIVIDIEEVFLHCTKSIVRSKLWLKDFLTEDSTT